MATVPNYPSNTIFSDQQKEAESEKKKEIKKVVKGHVVKKEKSLGEKFCEIFLGGDVKTVKDHIIFDTILPGLRNGLYDIFEGGLSMLLFGEKEGSRTRRDRGRSYVYTSYSQNFDRDRRRRDEEDRRERTTSSSLVDNIIFDTRGDAEDVLSEMIEYIEEYGAVSVKELYNFAGMDSDYTKEKYGWTNLNRAEVIRVREGYSLKLPRPVVID